MTTTLERRRYVASIGARRERRRYVDALLEARVRDALREHGTDDTVPGIGARRVARAYLVGALGNTPELLAPEHIVSNVDETCALFYGSSNEAASCMLDHLCDFDADVFLPGHHPLVQRGDAVELQAWAAFARRVHVVAGE